MRVLACLLLAACVAPDQQVLCSEALDGAGVDPTFWRLDDQIAHATGVKLFHGHSPGEQLKISTLERVISEAKDDRIPIIRYDQIAETHEPAIAIAIDDNAIDEWYALRPMLTAYNVHLTFFVCRWYLQDPQHLDELRQLAEDGNELEPHTVNHLQPVDYVAAHGLDAWLADEVDPSIQIMRDAGYEPKFFAYPFGARTDEMDAAMLTRVQAVRATGSHCKR